MPVSWREDLGGERIVIVYADPYTFEELERAMNEIFEHPLSKAGLRLLVDRRSCTAPMPEFIRRLVSSGERNRERLVGSRVAVVVSDDVAYGMGRMAENLTEAKGLPPELRTFRDWDEAGRWLQGTTDREQAPVGELP